MLDMQYKNYTMVIPMLGIAEHCTAEKAEQYIRSHDQHEQFTGSCCSLSCGRISPSNASTNLGSTEAQVDPRGK